MERFMIHGTAVLRPWSKVKQHLLIYTHTHIYILCVCVPPLDLSEG